jgi:hypothetical protein
MVAGVDIHLFVPVDPGPTKSFLTCAGTGHNEPKRATDCGRLDATELRRPATNRFCRYTSLPIGRTGQGNNASFSRDEISAFDSVPNSPDLGIAGAHGRVGLDAPLGASRQSGSFGKIALWAYPGTKEDEVRVVGLAGRGPHEKRTIASSFEAIDFTV